MAFYIDIKNGRIVQRPVGTSSGPDHVVVDTDTARMCELADGQSVSPEQIQALRDGSSIGYRRATLQAADPERSPRPPSISRGSSPPLTLPSEPSPNGSQPTKNRQSSPAAGRARAAASFVEAVAWVVGVLGVIGGALLAIQTDVSEFTGEQSHPYVVAGIGLAVASAFQACIVIMIAAYIQFRTEP